MLIRFLLSHRLSGHSCVGTGTHSMPASFTVLLDLKIFNSSSVLSTSSLSFARAASFMIFNDFSMRSVLGSGILLSVCVF